MAVRNPHTIKNIELLGGNLMAGIHDNGDVEVRIAVTAPVAPETAASDVDPRLKP